MEADMEITDVEYPKRVRQQISVPFIWESKPGTPKRDFVISRPVSLISFPSPSKLTASVPLTPPPKSYDATKMDLLSEPYDSWNPFFTGADDYSIGFDLDNFNNPFVSGHTVPDVPITEEKEEKDESLVKQSIDEEEDSTNWQENLDSLSETEQYSSSSEGSVNTQNVAGSINFDMELLFALSSPEVSFLGSILEKNGDDKQGPGGTRDLTLGELIMLSRKLSTHKNKPQIVQKKNPSKELMKKILVTCF